MHQPIDPTPIDWDEVRTLTKIRHFAHSLFTQEDHPPMTEPQNPFLLGTFNAFVTEGLSPRTAAIMTQAHVANLNLAQLTYQNQHLAKVVNNLDKLSAAMARIASLADPVELGRVLALIRAGDAKRAERAADREAQEEKVSFDNIFGLSNKELAS